MIMLDISRLKNSPGAEERLVKCFKMQPLQSGAEEILFNTPLRLDVLLSNNGDTIHLEGAMEGNIKVVCGRCLEHFDMDIREDLKETYYNESRCNAGSHEEDDYLIPFKGDSIDIAPEVVKALFSSLPMKLVCREDCLGLCQNCGKNLNMGVCDCPKDNIDVRLEKLKQLLGKN